MGVKVKHHRGAYWIFVDHKGQRKARRVGEGRAGKQAAEQAAAKIAARLADGGPLVVETPPAAPSFERAATEWLERYQSLFAVRRSTLANREHFITRHLVPFFAGRQASEITTELVEDFIGAKRAVGGSKRGKALADSTIRVNLPTLRMILDYCVRRRWLAANPLRGEALWRPTPKSEQPDPFTQLELAALVAAAELLAPAWGLMLRVWAQSGMRSGELRGLQHQDLDPRSGLVSIQRTRTQGATGPTKTARSVRQAAITHPTCEATPAWQPGATPESLSVLERLGQLTPLDPAAPLFGSLKHPGRLMEEREMHTLWRRTVARARVRPRPPETLRHSCISSLLSRGAPLLYAAQQSGHSARIMLASYARWQEQGAQVALQPTATPAQPMLAAIPLTPRDSASGAGYGILHA
jgi:integrase